MKRFKITLDNTLVSVKNRRIELAIKAATAAEAKEKAKGNVTYSHYLPTIVECREI